MAGRTADTDLGGALGGGVKGRCGSATRGLRVGGGGIDAVHTGVDRAAAGARTGTGLGAADCAAGATGTAGGQGRSRTVGEDSAASPLAAGAAACCAASRASCCLARRLQRFPLPAAREVSVPVGLAAPDIATIALSALLAAAMLQVGEGRTAKHPSGSACSMLMDPAASEKPCTDELLLRLTGPLARLRARLASCWLASTNSC